MSDFSSRASMATPLHARTAELCATNHWAEEEGFTVPAVYSSLREEQEALVTRVGMSDLSARQCWLVEGPDAGVYLSWLSISDVTRLEAGQTARTLWCDDAGFVRGEGVIVRFASSSFEVRTAVRDFAWSRTVRAIRREGHERDRHAGRDRRARTLPRARGGGWVDGRCAGRRCRWARRVAAGASGADARASGDGELWTGADDGIVVWDRLWKAGAGLGVAAVGAEALEALRVESAIARAGVDWLPAQLARSSSDMRLPGDLGVGPDLTRRFNGARALGAHVQSGRPALVHLSADEPIGVGAVTVRNATVGTITSSCWSEGRGAAFALGWLEADAVKAGSKVTAQGKNGTAQAEILPGGIWINLAIGRDLSEHASLRSEGLAMRLRLHSSFSLGLSASRRQRRRGQRWQASRSGLRGHVRAAQAQLGSEAVAGENSAKPPARRCTRRAALWRGVERQASSRIWDFRPRSRKSKCPRIMWRSALGAGRASSLSSKKNSANPTSRKGRLVG
jgi:aminomethyltransferase